MPAIRKEQMERFDEAAGLRFEQRLGGYLREKHGGAHVRLAGGPRTIAALTPEDFEALVRNGVARARSYGLTWESSIAAFVVTMFTEAPNFDTHPVAKTVLSAGGTPPDDRLTLLWGSMCPEHWEAVRRDYDPAAWQGLANA